VLRQHVSKQQEAAKNRNQLFFRAQYSHEISKGNLSSKM
jgi:hypothetical protein